MEIIMWFNVNQGFVISLLTLIYVAATIFILRSNRRSADAAERQLAASQNALQKSIDMQLYEKRLAVANNIEENDYTNTTMEISLLFNKKMLHQVLELKELETTLVYAESSYKKYWELAEQQGYDHSIRIDDYEDVLPQYIKESELQDEKFAVVEDTDGCEYDIKEICEKLTSLRSDIDQKRRTLKNDVWHFTKEKLDVGGDAE